MCYQAASEDKPVKNQVGLSRFFPTGLWGARGRQVKQDLGVSPHKKFDGQKIKTKTVPGTVHALQETPNGTNTESYKTKRTTVG